MKIRILKLTPESLTGLLQGKPSTFTSNIPIDAEILDIKMDLFTKQVSMVIRSECFEDIAEAMPIPEFELAKTDDSKAPPKPAIVLIKPQVMQVPEPKSNVAKLPQMQPSGWLQKWRTNSAPNSVNCSASPLKRTVW